MSVQDALVQLLPRLRRFARSLTGSADKADDLVQTVCVRILAEPQKVEGVTKLDSWFFRIIQNEWFDEARRLGRRATASIEAADSVSGANLEDQLIARSSLARVRTFLEELPEEQKAVVMLVCVHGLSYQEAADVLDIPTGTVMSRLARGRIRLAQRMGLLDGADRTE